MHLKRYKITAKGKPFIRTKKIDIKKYREKKEEYNRLIAKNKKDSKKIAKRLLNKDSFLSLKKWKNILKDQPVFILGNGPSIGKQNLSLLDNFFTIGLNRIFLIYQPTVLFWQDVELWRQESRRVVACNSIKVSRDHSDPQKLFINYKLKLNPPMFNHTPELLHGRGNSCMIAVQFAVALGCSPIVMVGTDCKYQDGKTDFYGKNPDHKPYTLRMCEVAMTWVKKNCPVEIVNCGKVEYWPKQKLEKVVEKLKETKKSPDYFRKLFSK